jgi:hypothetical protein
MKTILTISCLLIFATMMVVVKDQLENGTPSHVESSLLGQSKVDTNPSQEKPSQDRKVDLNMETVQSDAESDDTPNAKTVVDLKALPDFQKSQKYQALAQKMASRDDVMKHLIFIHGLGEQLPLDEREHLYSYVIHGETDGRSLVVKDEVLRQLERQKLRPAEYENTLAAIVKDRSIDGDLRGYVVQHLWSAYSKVDDVGKDIVRKSLVEAVGDSKSDVSGTAIMAMADLGRKFPGSFSKEDTQRLTRQMLSADIAHQPSLLSAVSVAGEMGVAEGLEVALRQLRESNDVAMKIASIYAIGKLGDEKYLEILNDMAEQNVVYQPSVELAISNIRKHNE